jgi:cytochrome P450
MLQPAFHRELVERLSARVRESAESLAGEWSRSRSETHEVDLGEEMMQLSMVVIGHRLFGCDIGRHEAAEASALMRECQEYVANRMLSFDLARGAPSATTCSPAFVSARGRRSSLRRT